MLAIGLTLLLLGADQLRAQTGQLPIILSNRISMRSTNLIDSFDSSDPTKSTNGLYDPAKYQMHANIGLIDSTGSDLRHGFVYGNVLFNGPAIENSTNVIGSISSPFSSPIAGTSNPTWVPGTFTEYSGPAAVAAKVVTASSSPTVTRIKINGDFNVSGGNTFLIVPAGDTDGYIEIWVTGKFTTSGSGRIIQDPRAHVTWIVDKDITTNGDAYQNGSGDASNVWFIGVGIGKINITGFGNLIATVKAPSRDVTVSDGGALSGGIAAKTLTMSGTSSIHCDEALQ